MSGETDVIRGASKAACQRGIPASAKAGGINPNDSPGPQAAGSCARNGKASETEE